MGVCVDDDDDDAYILTYITYIHTYTHYAGLLPTVAAIKAGKDIALANKETLIAGGPVVVPLLAKHNVKMLPADSEHSGTSL